MNATLYKYFQQIAKVYFVTVTTKPNRHCIIILSDIIGEIFFDITYFMADSMFFVVLFEKNDVKLRHLKI